MLSDVLHFLSNVEVRVPEWLTARKMEWAVHIPIETLYVQLALRKKYKSIFFYLPSAMGKNSRSE